MRGPAVIPAGLTVRGIGLAGDAGLDGGFVYDAPGAGVPVHAEGVLLPREPLSRARELLASGARRVYVGHAAMVDGSGVARLAAQFGGERVGVYVPARRMEINWAMDTMSNADFMFMRPSICEPCWEILDVGGARTGTHAAWWIGTMLEAGASSALLRVDIEDDTDASLGADMVERFGDRLWIAPLDSIEPPLVRWAAEANVRQVALPASLAMEQAA